MCSNTLAVGGATPTPFDTIEYQSKPVENAQVAFSPDQAGGRAAAGKTDANGRFQLTSLRRNDGVMPGKYKVSIAKREVVGSLTAEEAKAWFKKHSGPPPGKPVENSLPEVYGDADDSGLTAEVTVGGENDFKFSLK
jgi:hypothetical protein